MSPSIRRLLLAVVALPAGLMLGCSSTTTIKSDLVLDGRERARIDLHQQTQAMELVNDSDASVRVYVLDAKDRVVSNMMLSGRDMVRLDLAPARAIRFDNSSDQRAVVHWILRNDDRIQYSLAMNPNSLD